MKFTAFVSHPEHAGFTWITSRDRETAKRDLAIALSYIFDCPADSFIVVVLR